MNSRSESQRDRHTWADLMAGIHGLEAARKRAQLVAHGQTRLPSSDHEHIQRSLIG